MAKTGVLEMEHETEAESENETETETASTATVDMTELKRELERVVKSILESDDYTVEATDIAIRTLCALKDLKLKRLRCPISRELLIDPVILATGEKVVMRPRATFDGARADSHQPISGSKRSMREGLDSNNDYTTLSAINKRLRGNATTRTPGSNEVEGVGRNDLRLKLMRTRLSLPMNIDELRRMSSEMSIDASRTGRLVGGDVSEPSTSNHPTTIAMRGTLDADKPVPELLTASSDAPRISYMGEPPLTLTSLLHSHGLGKYAVQFQAEEIGNLPFPPAQSITAAASPLPLVSTAARHLLFNFTATAANPCPNRSPNICLYPPRHQVRRPTHPLAHPPDCGVRAAHPPLRHHRILTRRHPLFLNHHDFILNHPPLLPSIMSPFAPRLPDSTCAFVGPASTSTTTSSPLSTLATSPSNTSQVTIEPTFSQSLSHHFLSLTI